MKRVFIYLLISLLFLQISPILSLAQSLNAYQIIQKASQNRFGDSSYGEMKMQIVRPKYTRTLEMKNWSLGNDYSMVLITAPAKESGQVFLKRQNEMWNWIPGISRMMKLPPSMMSQGWMGSDYTNDDVINANALVEKYSHRIMGEEQVSGYDCYIIESMPLPDAKIIGGKKLSWVSKVDYFILKTQSFDEEDVLIRTELASDIKSFGNHRLPCRFEIIAEEKKDNKTIIEILTLDFEIKIETSFFSQSNMKALK
ncbi:MAG: outer membrane lipoprotein-sorting protein [Bacteroidales bacterium]|nr:outer membrane lipoprotein-sorting protein [Bacteroidales bacterium]